jgi:glycosyltransferase involved in cell wall biosynthesis
MSESLTAPRRLKGLWICRELPFPFNSGDKMYSAQLLKSVAEAGVELTVVGLAPIEPKAVPSDWPVRWIVVRGRRRSTLRSLFHVLPLVSAGYATPAYRATVSQLRTTAWDFVVLDQYGMGWALPEFQRQDSGPAPLVVHIAHDHEATLTASIYRNYRGSWLKRLVLWQNHLKTRALERQLASGSDLITSITEDDARLFAVDAPHSSIVVLKPGYSGASSDRSAITQRVPRHVVIVGSFIWVAKQQNLMQFIALADQLFAQNGIELHVIGSVPEKLAREIRAGARAVVLHGFVDDLQPHLDQARMAVVPEAIGGGFKLKILDYIFGGVPVATLSVATAGLDAELRATMLCCNDPRSLVAAVCARIDDFDELNRMRTEALSKAQSLFRWEDRGRQFIEALSALREDRLGAVPRAGQFSDTSAGYLSSPTDREASHQR